VVGVPGVVDTDTGQLRLATNVRGLEGRHWGDDIRGRLGLPVAVENDINLAAVGELWQGVARGVEDFVFLSVGTGLGAGLILHGELHRGRHGAAGEVDLVAAGRTDEIDPCAAAVSALAARLVAEEGAATILQPPFDVRSIFAAARGGDELARRVVSEEARRIALHLAPVAAVTDIALVVLGGGIGANADLLLGPTRDLLSRWLPYPPRVEVSSLGDAAVLTGALAVGLRAALDNSFQNRARA
jgi:predicted NBD/HSP70 family sugar kinase